MQLKPLEARGQGGGHGVCFLCAACLLLLVGQLWDVGCSFECNLLVPKVCTALFEFCWCERHLKIFYIHQEFITKL